MLIQLLLLVLSCRKNLDEQLLRLNVVASVAEVQVLVQELVQESELVAVVVAVVLELVLEQGFDFV